MTDSIELKEAAILLAPKTPMYVRGADPKVIHTTAGALLSEHVGLAVNVLVDVMQNGDSDTDRLRAAYITLQYASTHKQAQPSAESLSDAELFARVKAMCADVGGGAEK